MPPDASPDPIAHLVALLGLPGMGPTRLDRLLEGRDPVVAWSMIRAGGPPPVDLGHGGRQAWAEWVGVAASITPRSVAAAHTAAGVAMVRKGDPTYPPSLLDLEQAPPLVFHRGDPALLVAPRVAIVGTRRCTRYGHDLARELGRGLAASGVAVVSGLAAGIDAAAHQGVVDAGGVPVGVVGTGLDVVYPARNRGLWEAVGASGYLCSEAPLGTPPARWRFPSRNRIIAALAHVVVVVESHRSGGALLTAEAADALGRRVLAVPGSIRSPASEGTNRLLAATAHPCTGLADVLVALGLEGSPVVSRGAERPPPDGVPGRVLRGIGWEPVSLGRLVDELGMSVAAVAAAVAELEAAGWVVRHGQRIERVGSVT
ncbi:MAG: DNA-processing protein DprA [Acidimicrobiales bacterium]|nr:DNA-processing protein DprA [Acidimicrobiales bacterium]